MKMFPIFFHTLLIKQFSNCSVTFHVTLSYLPFSPPLFLSLQSGNYYKGNSETLSINDYLNVSKFMGEFSLGISDDIKTGKNTLEICKTLHYNHLKGKNESSEVTNFPPQFLYILKTVKEKIKYSFFIG